MMTKQMLPYHLQQLSDEELVEMGFDFELQVYSVDALLTMTIEKATEAKVNDN